MYLGILSLLFANAQAAYVPFQGTGNFDLTENNGIFTVSDVSLNQGMAFNNSNDSSLLGYGGFDTFSLVANENLHFWYTDLSNNLVNLYGVIQSFTIADFSLANAQFSFFGLTSDTGEIFEVSGSRTINSNDVVTSNSINASGQHQTVPEPSVLLLLAVGVIGVSMFRKKSSQDDYYGKMITA